MENKKYRFKYEFENDMDHPHPYREFTVYENGEVILHFYTNQGFRGMFIDSRDGGYKQTAGTCDFKMSYESNAIKRKLRKMALENMDHIEFNRTLDWQ